MKTLKQIREDFNEQYLDQIDLMLEVKGDITGKDTKAMTARIPSSKEMPVMLIFRRISYRLYPNKQVVALYYSHMIGKYLSVPYGPGGTVNLSEAVIMDELDEDWQDVNRKDKTDGLSQAAVNAYRREHPGSKLKTAVTEKNPSGKRAARRKSFCSRMGGMKKRLTSAKTARDPDSRINKALRRWNCEEDFKLRLEQLREEAYGAKDAALDAASFIPGPVGSAASLGSAYRSWKRGDKVGAALDVAGALPGVGYLAKGAKAAKAASEVSKVAKAGKAAEVASKVGKAAKTAGSKVAKVASKVGKVGRLAGAAAGLAAGLSGGSSDSSSSAAKEKTYGGFARDVGKVKTGSAAPVAAQTATEKSKERQALKKLSENTITDIQSMLESGDSLHEMVINGKTVTLNNNMAKRIIEVYDSVNTKNKKIVEGMLNEDLESFKKLLNFSIRN